VKSDERGLAGFPVRALFGFRYLVVGWRPVKRFFKTFGKIRGVGKPHLKSHFQHTPKIALQ
jgi:hypothetical protein